MKYVGLTFPEPSRHDDNNNNHNNNSNDNNRNSNNNNNTNNDLGVRLPAYSSYGRLPLLGEWA